MPYHEGWRALCPFHDERNPSLQVGPGPGYYCYACEASGSLDTLARHLGLLPPEDEYYLRVPEYNTSSSFSVIGRAVREYDYVDADGTLLFRVVRHESPKSFSLRRPCWWKGKLLGMMSGYSGRKVPYRLNRLTQQPDRLVVFVEGEKDVQNLERCGFLATTTPLGAAAWHNGYATFFTGRRVLCIPDNDERGRKYMDGVQRSLARVNARCRQLHLAGLKDGGDVSDWLQEHTLEELRGLIQEATDEIINGRTIM